MMNTFVKLCYRVAHDHQLLNYPFRTEAFWKNAGILTYTIGYFGGWSLWKVVLRGIFLSRANWSGKVLLFQGNGLYPRLRQSVSLLGLSWENISNVFHLQCCLTILSIGCCTRRQIETNFYGFLAHLMESWSSGRAWSSCKLLLSAFVNKILKPSKTQHCQNRIVHCTPRSYSTGSTNKLPKYKNCFGSHVPLVRHHGSTNKPRIALSGSLPELDPLLT